MKSERIIEIFGIIAYWNFAEDKEFSLSNGRDYKRLWWRIYRRW